MDTNSSGRHGRRTRELAPARSSAASAFAQPSTAATKLSWQQRYDHLVEANHRLKQQLQEQDAAHRRSRTVVKYEPTLPNNDVFTKQLIEENRQLLARYRALELRLANLATVSPRKSQDTNRRAGGNTIKKTTRIAYPLKLLVKNCGVQTDTNVTIEFEPPSAHPKPADEDAEMNEPAQPLPEHVVAVLAELKQRLGDLQVDLERLHQENELLRAERDEQQENEDQNHNRPKWDERQVLLRSKHEHRELENLLRDRVRQMNVLEAQFKHLQDKLRAQSLAYKQSLGQVEQLTTELVDAKQTVLKQRETLESHRDQTTEIQLLEREVHLLRSENASLNDAVAAFTARPLASLDAMVATKSIQVAMLEDDKTRLEKELHKVEQDLRLVTQVNDKLRRRVDRLTSEMARLSIELQQVVVAMEECKASRAIAELQLQHCLSGDHEESKQYMEAVGRALGAMRLQDSSSRSDTNSMTPDVSSTSVGSGGELPQARMQKMAELTRLIQDDVRAQVHELRVTHQAAMRDLQRQLKVWKERATARPGDETVAVKVYPQVSSGSSRQPGTEAKSGDHLHSESYLDTLMQVRIDRLHLQLSTAATDLQAKTLVLFCDYYDFEPQMSPVVTWNEGDVSMEMEIGFKLGIDQAFCRSPASELMTVELHEITQATSHVVAVVSVSMDTLFLSSDGRMVMVARLMEPHSKVPIGSFRLVAALSQPVNHVFRVWKRDAKPSLALATRGITSVPPSETSISLTIRVVCLVLAPSMERGGVSLRYRFMGHPSTRVVTEPSRTAYGFRFVSVDRVKAHDVPGDESFLRYLDRYELVLDVETPAGVKMGQAQVPFKAVAQRIRGGRDSSASIISTTVCSSGSDRPVGRAWVEVDVDTGTSLRAMKATELQPIIQRVFGHVTTSRIDWGLFCRAINLTASERACRELLWTKCEAQSLTMNKVLGRISSMDALKAALKEGGASLSRSDLSLLSSTLIQDDKEALNEPLPGRGDSSLSERLQLIIATSDVEWLRVESTMRRRVHVLNVLVDYAQDDDHDAGGIDWDTFTYRVRFEK